MVEERKRIPDAAVRRTARTRRNTRRRTRLARATTTNASASQARSILNTEQITAYTEYQQWQKEMRAQFGALMPAGPRGMIRGANGNSVTYMNAAPAGGAIVSAEAVYLAAPLAAEKKK